MLYLKTPVKPKPKVKKKALPKSAKEKGNEQAIKKLFNIGGND